jgi:predicted acylesterase/phospholipase RssA
MPPVEIIKLQNGGVKKVESPQGRVIRPSSGMVTPERRMALLKFYKYLADQGNDRLLRNFEKNPDMMKGSMVIGVLGGGGPKGLVHVGALQALKDYGILLDLAAATSAGSLVGTPYMGGVPPDKIRTEVERLFKGFGDGIWNILRSLDWKSFGGRLWNGLCSFNPKKFLQSFNISGAVNSGPIAATIRRLLPNKTFGDLPNLFITATTHESKKLVVFGQGYTEDFPVDEAVRASCNMPGVFSPVYVEHKKLTFLEGKRRSFVEFQRTGIPIAKLVKETIPIESAFLYDGGSKNNIPIDLGVINYDKDKDVILVFVLGYPGKEEETYGPHEEEMLKKGLLKSYVGDPPPNAGGCPNILSATSGALGAAMYDQYVNDQIQFAKENIVIFQSRLWNVGLRDYGKFNDLYNEGYFLVDDFMKKQKGEVI